MREMRHAWRRNGRSIFTNLLEIHIAHCMMGTSNIKDQGGQACACMWCNTQTYVTKTRNRVRLFMTEHRSCFAITLRRQNSIVRSEGQIEITIWFKSWLYHILWLFDLTTGIFDSEIMWFDLNLSWFNLRYQQITTRAQWSDVDFICTVQTGRWQSDTIEQWLHAWWVRLPF